MKTFISALILCAVSVQASALLLDLRSPIVYSTNIVDNSRSILAEALSVFSSNIYYAPPAVPALAEGTYIATTPGSEHITALPGHFTSTASINLEKAPGTKKDGSSITLFPIRSLLRSDLPLSYAPLIIQAPQPAAATYLAKNLGVEHTAPLPGHLISTTSLNLEKAPGSV